MSKRNTNADKVIKGCIVDGSYYGTKTDKLRYIDGTILDTGTPIGKFEEAFSISCDCYLQFVVLTMQDFKSQKSWKTHKKALANSANAQDIAVVFVPQLDMGFGVEDNLFVDNSIEYNKLISVAKYSQDEDIKTACMVYEKSTNKIIAYTYNQYIEDQMMHAEQLLVSYLSIIDKYDTEDLVFVSMLEPCRKCLWEMIVAGASNIAWAYNHKEKWSTYDYWELVDNIHSMKILSTSGTRIQYYKCKNDKVTKFYEKENKNA